VKNAIPYILVLALSLPAATLATEDTWTRKADMPTARSHLAAATVGWKIYAIGGHVFPSSGLSAVDEYDPATDTWQRKASMPMPRGELAVVALEGKIYAIGGMTAPRASSIFATVEEYDPAADTWKTKSPMPTPRFALSAGSVNGKIYAIGGLTPTVITPNVEEYDPVANTWTRKADMPTPREKLSTCVVGGRIYTLGGFVPYTGNVTPTVEEYDPLTDTWTAKANMLTARAAFAACVAYGRIFAFGGIQTQEGRPLSVVEVYDPATNSWSRASDMPAARSFQAASVVGRRIYVMGGTTGAPPWPAVAAVQEYVTGLPLPPPDFNGDYQIDIEDLLIMIQRWGQQDTMCDVAPPPLGDDRVDIQDLEVLMSLWGQEVRDPTLVAHWALDETEGRMAPDSAGQIDGVLLGDPLWRPSDGRVGGALQLDGRDDCVTTEYVVEGARFGFVVSPSDGPFSVFMWVKGGAPGQVTLSQIGGANWLMARPSDGALATELKSTRGGPLSSETIITDGAWHRIGFVRGGSSRQLYVDDILVAEDTHPVLAGCYRGLNIGCANNQAPGTFWTGLIDDVRVYTRAVKP
jgi:N-acetylneuraminic acid mutarotase